MVVPRTSPGTNLGEHNGRQVNSRECSRPFLSDLLLLIDIFQYDIVTAWGLSHESQCKFNMNTRLLGKMN